MPPPHHPPHPSTAAAQRAGHLCRRAPAALQRLLPKWRALTGRLTTELIALERAGRPLPTSHATTGDRLQLFFCLLDNNPLLQRFKTILERPGAHTQPRAHACTPAAHVLACTCVHARMHFTQHTTRGTTRRCPWPPCHPQYSSGEPAWRCTGARPNIREGQTRLRQHLANCRVLPTAVEENELPAEQYDVGFLMPRDGSMEPRMLTTSADGVPKEENELSVTAEEGIFLVPTPGALRSCALPRQARSDEAPQGLLAHAASVQRFHDVHPLRLAHVPDSAGEGYSAQELSLLQHAACVLHHAACPPCKHAASLLCLAQAQIVASGNSVGVQER